MRCSGKFQALAEAMLMVPSQGSLFAVGSCCLSLWSGESVPGLHLAQSQNWLSDVSLANQGTPSPHAHSDWPER